MTSSHWLRVWCIPQTRYSHSVSLRLHPSKGLSLRGMHQLVGSFFNRHAMTVLHTRHYYLYRHAKNVHNKNNTQCVTPLWLLVGIWFQVYFIALTGLLFTFPSRYLFTIGLQKYLALPVSTGRFPQAIHVLRYSRIVTEQLLVFSPTGLLPAWALLPSKFG